MEQEMNNQDRDIIRTQRLGLRPFEMEDETSFYELNHNPEVMRHFPNRLNEFENLDFLKRIVEHQKNHGFSWFAAELLADRSFIGFIGIVHCRLDTFFTPCIEIGWRILPEYWGRGLATEGAKACLHYAFSELNIKRIYSFTTRMNTSSENVMKRIGMLKVGEFNHPKLIGHSLERHVLYQIEAQSGLL